MENLPAISGQNFHDKMRLKMDTYRPNAGFDDAERTRDAQEINDQINSIMRKPTFGVAKEIILEKSVEEGSSDDNKTDMEIVQEGIENMDINLFNMK
jgi:hypothetical protein